MMKWILLVKSILVVPMCIWLFKRALESGNWEPLLYIASVFGLVLLWLWWIEWDARRRLGKYDDW